MVSQQQDEVFPADNISQEEIHKIVSEEEEQEAAPPVAYAAYAALVRATDAFVASPSPAGLRAVTAAMRAADVAMDECGSMAECAEDCVSQEQTAKAPPGWKKTVEKMKEHEEIDNPFALAWHMKNKGDKPHKKSSSPEAPPKTFDERVQEFRERNKRPEPTGDPYHFEVKRDGVVVGVMSFLADSPEDAQSKMGEMYRPPPGDSKVTVEGPFPGKG